MDGSKVEFEGIVRFFWGGNAKFEIRFNIFGVSKLLFYGCVRAC